ncbi:MAG: hypothetical protein MJ250_00015 [Alphaproteobacteria bacterium]|nr:hypothetical protein [Alphaproteobacteria bacterium]
MILKNKRTHEKLEISHQEFKIKFKKEIENAYQSYKRTELAKPYFKTVNSTESDFYFNLQWNFNNHGNSVWYIEKL